MEAISSPAPPLKAPPPLIRVRELMLQGQDLSKKLQILLPAAIQTPIRRPPAGPPPSDQYCLCKPEPEPTSKSEQQQLGELPLLQQAQSLLKDILGSFTHAITTLDGHRRLPRGGCSSSSTYSDAVDDHHYDDDDDDDDYYDGDYYDGSCKISTTTAGKKLRKLNPPTVKGKDRRGSYKRRRTVDTWTRETASLEDGHAWRKYGQKAILGTNNPRSYFRCTHKYDQGCEASKQVQLKEDGKGLFLVTYIGHHTCRDPHSAPPIVMDSDPKDGSYLLNFQQQQQQHQLFSQVDHTCSFPLTSVKQELICTSTTATLNQYYYTSSRHSLSSSLQHKELAIAAPHEPGLITELSDAGDMLSGVCSSVNSYNMQEEDNTTVDDSVSFEDILIDFDDGDHHEWF